MTEFLEYELLSPETADPVIMRITGQRERGFRDFTASNGVRVVSHWWPAYGSIPAFDDKPPHLPAPRARILCVWGKHGPKDDSRALEIPLDDWPAVKQAIRELNNEKAKEAIRELIKDAVEDVETWPDWKKNYSLLATCSTTLEPRAKKEKDMKEDRYEFDLDEWDYRSGDPGEADIILTRKKPKVKVEYCLHEGYKSTQYGQYHIVQFRVAGWDGCKITAVYHQADGEGYTTSIQGSCGVTHSLFACNKTTGMIIGLDAHNKWSAPILLPESVYSRLDEITKALEKANGGKG